MTRIVVGSTRPGRRGEKAAVRAETPGDAA